MPFCHVLAHCTYTQILLLNEQIYKLYSNSNKKLSNNLYFKHLNKLDFCSFNMKVFANNCICMCIPFHCSCISWVIFFWYFVLNFPFFCLLFRILSTHDSMHLAIHEWNYSACVSVSLGFHHVWDLHERWKYDENEKYIQILFTREYINLIIQQWNWYKMRKYFNNIHLIDFSVWLNYNPPKWGMEWLAGIVLNVVNRIHLHEIDLSLNKSSPQHRSLKHAASNQSPFFRMAERLLWVSHCSF